MCVGGKNQFSFSIIFNFIKLPHLGKQPQSDLTTILNELNDDIVQSEIYNPFTPVVSPTSEQHPQIVDKIFVQTSSGYRSVDNNSYFKNPSIGGDSDSNK